MLPSDAEALLSRAAAPTLARIRAERAAVRGVSARLLAYLERHLLDPGLDSRAWLAACGVRSGTMEMEFHDSVGVPVGLYLWDVRLEIAARLLRETDLSADDVGLLLEFADEASFVTAFGQWSGLTPDGYREHARRLAAELGPLPERFHERAVLARAHAGKLEPAAARELYGWLVELAWRRGHPAAGSDHERMAAERLWERIRDRSIRVRDVAVRAALHLSQRGKAEAPG
ncbi:MAG TPA: AraC family transcriptional regulator [Thermoanaerobaculia bacterium]|jgi:AraC-like DNA-binding protein